jgi:hypothetical protein
MKILFGSTIVAGSGKIGGHVVSKNRAGAYMRTKVSPVNARTAAQVAARSRLSSVSASWRALGASVVLAWNNAVADFKKTNVFGNTVTPSGFNLFQRLNNNLANISGSPLTTPPVPVAVSVFTSASIAGDDSAHTLIATVTPETLPVSEKVIVRATAPISPGKSYVKSELRQITVLSAVVAGSIDLSTAYTAKFGNLAGVGKKVFVEFIHVNSTTGQASQPQKVVTAIVS